MDFSLHQIPFFETLKDSQRILLAGAGGGFDIYSGIPLLLNLLKQGKRYPGQFLLHLADGHHC